MGDGCAPDGIFQQAERKKRGIGFCFRVGKGPEAFRAADEIFGSAAFYGEWVSGDAQSYHDVAVLFFSENRFRAGDMGFDG